MTVLVLSVALVLAVSGLCSLAEAALYAVNRAYVRNLSESGSVSGRLLMKFKANMERPIAAILILNTVANTAGATVAGAQAQLLFGESALIWFSVVFTLAVLFLAEILPKVVGVVYNRPIATALSVPVNGAIKMLSPLIWLSDLISHRIQGKEILMVAPEEEVETLARISAEEGSILPIEAQLVKNVLALNEVKARDIMTPRTVVFKAPSNMTLQEVADNSAQWTHSRVPIFAEDDQENWIGMVLRRDVYTGLANDEFDRTLESICKPIHFVPETTPGHKLLSEFLKRRSLLFGVVDEYGGLSGIVTLEDVMESLIGAEIVDEYDAAVDMQEVARRRSRGQREED
jgi:CBS domain containing-hemolysin-like protein